ncbi:ubiquinone anaerobic biosynthesis accessory factor UbiT [Oceanisphaera avium]|nr:SCP2 sterol-binding domain-containing protein [Oceanisphaera avium]
MALYSFSELSCMNAKQFLIHNVLNTLPKVAKHTVNWLPPIACQFTLERLFNQFFKKELAGGDLQFMEQKWVRVKVQDLNVHFSISVVNHHQQPSLKVQPHLTEADVALAGDMEDLMLLMTQQVDPDTLFFRRKLSLSGDTELGLQLKNFLDTIELQTHLPAFAHQWSSLLAEQLMDRHHKRAA